ncbi:hypothetical protein CRE_06942 [Caenorhabditis remanei]|uniref:Uncharacterized protein n=1 Tax=Caenorhabditis remanei TaxID=31234 RepID=E3N6J8_CAERE|nr:hypothetical protein CRE_06942 [Caenorhabditis remanei]
MHYFFSPERPLLRGKVNGSSRETSNQYLSVIAATPPPPLNVFPRHACFSIIKFVVYWNRTFFVVRKRYLSS